MTTLFAAAALLLFASVLQNTQAAKLAIGQIIYFDTTYSSCSAITNFAELDAVNNGVLFLGDSNPTSTAGRGNGKAAISANTGEPVHTHTGQGLTATTGSTNACSTPGLFTEKLKSGDGTVDSSSPGITDAKGAGVPFVQVLACKITYANNMELPIGGIVNMDMSTTEALATKTCGASDFVDFAAGNGRFLVASSSALASPFYAQNSVAQLTSTTYSTFGDHVHSFSSMVNLPVASKKAGLTGTTCITPGDKAVTGNLYVANAGLPFKVTKQCQAATDLSVITAPQLPAGALVFFAAATCPHTWSPATSSALVGRLIVSLKEGDNLATFGSASLLTPSSTNSEPHHHESLTGAKAKYPKSFSPTLQSNNNGVDQVPSGYPVKSAPSGTNSFALPTIHALLCTKLPPTMAPTRAPTMLPTFPPTMAPTHAPTMPPTLPPTLAPTVAPTQAPTTKTPTFVPTAAPTREPTTRTPTHEPTNAPTQEPTTKAPTSEPTVAPTQEPTTPIPTVHPSISPTHAPTKLPTLAPTFAPTLLPTLQPTAKPSTSPTHAPTKLPTLAPTLLPTLQPTAEPTTLTPTLLPTAQPTTLAPSVPGETRTPTLLPTSQPTAEPTTLMPTRLPTSDAPTKSPTASPTKLPTTLKPTALPSQAPTQMPTTLTPTVSPTDMPSQAPSTLAPTLDPTVPTTTTMAPVIPITLLRPTTSNSPSKRDSYIVEDEAKADDGTAVAAGGAIGGILAFALIAGLVMLVVRRRKSLGRGGNGGDEVMAAATATGALLRPGTAGMIMYSFQASNSDELSVDADIDIVLVQDHGDWVTVKLKNFPAKMGLVPKNYIDFNVPGSMQFDAKNPMHVEIRGD